MAVENRRRPSPKICAAIPLKYMPPFPPFRQPLRPLRPSRLRVKFPPALVPVKHHAALRLFAHAVGGEPVRFGDFVLDVSGVGVLRA